MARFVAELVPLPIMRSPVAVIGERALNAADLLVCPVPPLAIAIVVPFHVPLVIVPTVVSDVLPANGDAPMVLYEIVTDDEPLNVCGLEPPDPPLLTVNELVVVPPEGAAHVAVVPLLVRT